MRYKSLSLLLVAAISQARAGAPPRSQTTGKLFDAKPASRGGGILPPRPYQRPDNASVTFFDGSGDFGDLELVERQSCAPGKHLCSSGRGCCDDYENCTPTGCCTKPMETCWTGCHNPKETICCEERRATCDVGEVCTDDGCCKEGYPKVCNGMCYDPETKQCCDNGDICDRGDGCVGDGICCDGYLDLCGDQCYDPIFTTCCIDGDFAWSCDRGRECCIESHGCVYTSSEICCATGACDKDGSCCENECCSSNEVCGSNGYCSLAQNPTVTRTVTEDNSAETGQPGRTGRSDGCRNLWSYWTLFSAAAGAVTVCHLSIF